MDYAEYRTHDALGLAELVAAREVSPTELLDVAIARAEAVNGLPTPSSPRCTRSPGPAPKSR